MLNIENFEPKLNSIVNSKEWKYTEALFGKARHIFVFGNGGNMGIADHGAIDISRITDKNAMSPGSAVLATSIIGDTTFEYWFKNWLRMRLRGLESSDCMAIGLSCSISGQSSNSIMEGLSFTAEKGIPSILISAQEKKDIPAGIVAINQCAKFYHTSEILSLALMYQLIESAGFQCPSLRKKEEERRSDIA